MSPTCPDSISSLTSSYTRLPLCHWLRPRGFLSPLTGNFAPAVSSPRKALILIPCLSMPHMCARDVRAHTRMDTPALRMSGSFSPSKSPLTRHIFREVSPSCPPKTLYQCFPFLKYDLCHLLKEKKSLHARGRDEGNIFLQKPGEGCFLT